MFDVAHFPACSKWLAKPYQVFRVFGRPSGARSAPSRASKTPLRPGFSCGASRAQSPSSLGLVLCGWEVVVGRVPGDILCVPVERSERSVPTLVLIFRATKIFSGLAAWVALHVRSGCALLGRNKHSDSGHQARSMDSSRGWVLLPGVVQGFGGAN